MNNLLRHYADTLDALASKDLLRRLPATPHDEPMVRRMDFSGNDYLGLAARQELVDAAQEAGRLYGAGSTGSRLLSGNTPLHEAFEARIATDKGSEAALIFTSGYQANAACIAALLDQHTLGNEPLVFADRLNHASMHLGCALAEARQVRYRHLDLEHLAELLEKHKADKRPKFILSETVFGMDGDMADVVALQKLSQDYGALLYMDEAHATGLFGPRGYGLTEALDLAPTTFVMGTLSKAVGVSGGYVACARVLRDYIVNKAGGFIFSTAPSPLVVGAALRAWEMLPGLSAQRAQLQENAAWLRSSLGLAGFDTGTSSTHIVPVILGDADRTLRAKARLAELGITVSAVRPPTVPQGTSRLRLGLSAAHSREDLAALVEAMKGL